MVSFFEEDNVEEIAASEKNSEPATCSCIDTVEYPEDDEQDIEQALFEAYW